MTLLASLFDDKILFFAIRSKILTPFLISSFLIFISGKPDANEPPSKVSLAVCAAFLPILRHEEFLSLRLLIKSLNY